MLRLPHIVASGEGEELEIELLQDMVSLEKLNLPVYITVSQVFYLVLVYSLLISQMGDTCLVVDTSPEEASCVNCRVMVAVNDDKHFCGFVKEGRAGLSATVLHDALMVN